MWGCMDKGCWYAWMLVMVDGLMDGWTDGWMVGWMYVYIHGLMDGCMNAWMNAWMRGCRDMVMGGTGVWGDVGTQGHMVD